MDSRYESRLGATTLLCCCPRHGWMQTSVQRSIRMQSHSVSRCDPQWYRQRRLGVEAINSQGRETPRVARQANSRCTTRLRGCQERTKESWPGQLDPTRLPLHIQIERYIRERETNLFGLGRDGRRRHHNHRIRVRLSPL